MNERLELAEIQGLVLSGYAERPCAKYAVFAIDDVPRAQRWLSGLVDRVQYAEFLATGRAEQPLLRDVCINVAFTYAGFERLGLGCETLSGFSGSFRSGMSAPHRARQLGDDGPSAPERWLWGGPETPEVHGVLLVYAGRDDGDADEDALCADAIAREVCAANGLTTLTVRETLPIQQKQRAEHFGFADGISNPTLAGMQRTNARDVIADGEVLLGYRNVYGKYGLSPQVARDDSYGDLLPQSRVNPARRDFGRNGSYLVFRELKQDVALFWQTIERAAAALPERRDPIWLASRLVGRWPNGVPVTCFPELEDPHRESHDNDFGYHDHGDYYGTSCPIGSHVRRTNPRETWLPVPHDPPLRDDVARELAKQRAALKDRHRLLRRGRIFGPRRCTAFDLSALKQEDGVERGLHFLCCVANLRRQFEFVQGTWVVNPHFAGLSRDPDPLLAARRRYPFDASSFALPGCPARFVDGLERFVETRGGAYLFLPSRSALRYLAALGRRAELSAPSEPPADATELRLSELFAPRMERSLHRDETARRALHARCHGVVRARLDVPSDLPKAWQVGLFVAGASYPAWVRFSSGSGHEKPPRRDVHGLAIKVMNAPSRPRASDFEVQTQDFVLIDAPRLMVRGPSELLELAEALEGGALALASYIAKHPRVLARMVSIASPPAHPLARTYHSVTPFAYGERRVRWVVRRQRGTPLAPLAAGDDPMRETLRNELSRGPVVLELCVQNRGTRPLPLEDASASWDVPEERVATLTLTPEGFGEREQEQLGEDLHFSPWNALNDHRPLGALNRMRRLYRGLYELRMRRNGKLPFEPHEAEAR